MKIMTVETVLALVAEFRKEREKTVDVPHDFGRRGEMMRRSHTDRYYELMNLIDSDEAKVFKCGECGEMCGWFDLETWCCDFETGGYLCSYCYEDAMGEDL